MFTEKIYALILFFTFKRKEENEMRTINCKKKKYENFTQTHTKNTHDGGK